MAFGKPKSRISPIAIDFGADSIKLLQIVPGDTPELVALGASIIPDEARSDLNMRQIFLEDALVTLLRRHDFKNRRVMLSIPAFQTMVNNLVINRVDAKEVDKQVELSLRTRLGIEPNRMVINNYPGAEVYRNDHPMREVITFASSRDNVMRYLDMVNRLKLEVAGVHTEAPCVMRAFAYTHPASKGESGRRVAYIDIGAAATKIVVAQGSQMLLAKTVHAGGDQWTRQLASEQKIGFDEARLARVAQTSAVGVAVAPAPAQALGAKEMGGCETTECLIDELNMTFRHYNTRYPEAPVEKLVFLGGEANRTQICQTLARSVRVAAQIGDPFARLSKINAGAAPMGVDLSQPQPGWAVAMGLCLSEANY